MAHEAQMAQALRQQEVTPKPEMLGTGLAAGGAKNIQQGAKYKAYAAESMMNGESPMTYEQWLAQGK